MFLHDLAPIRVLSRCLVSKISASELRRKFFKGPMHAGWVSFQRINPEGKNLGQAEKGEGGIVRGVGKKGGGYEVEEKKEISPVGQKEI